MLRAKVRMRALLTLVASGTSTAGFVRPAYSARLAVRFVSNFSLACCGVSRNWRPPRCTETAVVELRAVGLLELDRGLPDREVADVEAARLDAGRDALLRRRRLGRRGDGEDEQEKERGEGGERAHGAGRVAAQAAASRGFARRARRFAGPGASRNSSRIRHVDPAAARPVSTPRWPPGAVASSTRACGAATRRDGRPRPARCRRRGRRPRAPGRGCRRGRASRP